MKQSLFLLFIFFHATYQLHGQSFLDKIAGEVGNVAEIGAKIVTAPVEVLNNTGKVITGKADPSVIYQPYKDIARSAGNTIAASTELINEPQKYWMNKARSFASAAGGRSGEFVFDLGTFTQRFYGELATAGVNGINNTLQGQNPFELSAVPLAAAIRAARSQYSATSQPLPEDVKIALRGYFSESLLNKARYTIGSVEITLPNFIGQGAKMMGEDYGVTVDNIIVFNRNPGSYAQSDVWWAHEMTHVAQYERMGIEKFSFEYLRDAGKYLEREASDNANRISSSSVSLTAAYLPVRSYDMSGTQAYVDYQRDPEYFVAQCIFPNDRFGAQYLVTNFSRIIAVDPQSGNWRHIGFCTRPLLPRVAWSYDLPNANWRYAVGNDGKIYNPTDPIYDQRGNLVDYKNWNAIGYVVRFEALKEPDYSTYDFPAQAPKKSAPTRSAHTAPRVKKKSWFFNPQSDDFGVEYFVGIQDNGETWHIGFNGKCPHLAGGVSYGSHKNKYLGGGYIGIGGRLSFAPAGGFYIGGGYTFMNAIPDVRKQYISEISYTPTNGRSYTPEGKWKYPYGRVGYVNYLGKKSSAFMFEVFYQVSFITYSSKANSFYGWQGFEFKEERRWWGFTVGYMGEL